MPFHITTLEITTQKFFDDIFKHWKKCDEPIKCSLCSILLKSSGKYNIAIANRNYILNLQNKIASLQNEIKSLKSLQNKANSQSQEKEDQENPPKLFTY